MLRMTVEHRYCGFTKVIEGYSIADAFKKNGLDLNVWSVIEMEKIED